MDYAPSVTITMAKGYIIAPIRVDGGVPAMIFIDEASGSITHLRTYGEDPGTEGGFFDYKTNRDAYMGYVAGKFV